MSEVWRKNHPREFTDEPKGRSERITMTEERSEQMNIDHDSESAVCVRSPGTPPPHDVRLTSAGRGNPSKENARTNQPA